MPNFSTFPEKLKTMNKSVFNWEIWINKTRYLKTDSNADSVAATRRGDQSLLQSVQVGRLVAWFSDVRGRSRSFPGEGEKRKGPRTTSDAW